MLEKAKPVPAGPLLAPRATALGLGAVLLRIVELQSSGLTKDQIAERARVSPETIRRAAHLGPSAKLRPHTWVTIARNLEVPVEPVAAEHLTWCASTPKAGTNGTMSSRVTVRDVFQMGRRQLRKRRCRRKRSPWWPRGQQSTPQ